MGKSHSNRDSHFSSELVDGILDSERRISWVNFEVSLESAIFARPSAGDILNILNVNRIYPSVIELDWSWLCIGREDNLTESACHSICYTIFDIDVSANHERAVTVKA